MSARAPSPAGWDRVEEEILRAIRAVRFGSVEIVIHDSRVVQIERREKVRPGEGSFHTDPREPGP